MHTHSAKTGELNSRAVAHNPVGRYSFSAVATPIQLKKVVKDRLNVIGENHTESGKRREAERKIATEEANGGYWTESEFRVGKDTRWTSFTTDTRKKGDDPSLRADQNAVQLADYAKIWQELVRSYATIDSQTTINDDMKKALRLKAANMVCPSVDIELWVRGVRHQSDKPELIDAVKTLGEIMTTIKSGESDKPDLGEAEARVRDLLNTPGRERTFSVISIERSAHMHGAANEVAMDNPGIWKVGTTHQKHLSKLDSNDSAPPEHGFKAKYNILSREEFNDEYFTDKYDSKTVEPKIGKNASLKAVSIYGAAY